MSKVQQFTPWDWLKGFGYSLLCWPILCVSFALEDLYTQPDWDLIIFVVLGPAILGVILLIIELTLTRVFKERLYTSAIPVPNALRDLANCFWTLLAVLMFSVFGFLTTAVYFGEGVSLKGARPLVITLLIFTGGALGFRLLARWIYGAPRRSSLGATWREKSSLPRVLGYLGMIPLLILIPVVLIDVLEDPYTLIKLHFMLFMFYLWLCLRGVMTYPAGAWASTPWEYELRLWSLGMPWALTTSASIFGFGAWMIRLSLMDDDSIESTIGRVIAWLFIFSLGISLIYVGYRYARFFYTKYVSTYRFLKTLTARPDALVSWYLIHSTTQHKYSDAKEISTVYMTLSDGQEWSRSFEESEYPLGQFLYQNYPDLENTPNLSVSI